jgi:excisionase family DNA binding protein
MNEMNVQSGQNPPTFSRSASASTMALLTPKEAALLLKTSLSFLAKARMSGEGPPFTKIGRSVRYSETDLLQWMKSRRRLSTSE